VFFKITEYIKFKIQRAGEGSGSAFVDGWLDIKWSVLNNVFIIYIIHDRHIYENIILNYSCTVR